MLLDPLVTWLCWRPKRSAHVPAPQNQPTSEDALLRSSHSKQPESIGALTRRQPARRRCRAGSSLMRVLGLSVVHRQ
jgi:hypothetical protein